MDAQVKIQMWPRDMHRLIDRHIRSEMASGSAGAVSVYTDDVEHNVVRAPHGPLLGRHGARRFYDRLISDVDTETVVATRRYYGGGFCVPERQWSGTVPGSFLGFPRQGKHISFQLLHVWEFRDGLISRENVCLDGGSIVAQFTSGG